MHEPARHPMFTKKIYLASASPRRAELLPLIGVEFEVLKLGEFGVDEAVHGRQALHISGGRCWARTPRYASAATSSASPVMPPTAKPRRRACCACYRAGRIGCSPRWRWRRL